MINFKNEKSPVYKKGILFTQVIVLISFTLTFPLDDTIYEVIARGIWFVSSLVLLTLLGSKEVFAKKSKLGYLIYIFEIIFIFWIIYVFTMY